MDLRVAQAHVKTAPLRKRPPIVEEDLHRTPHRHPADDRQAFAQDGGKGTGGKLADRVGGEQAHCHEAEADCQAYASVSQQLIELMAREFGLVTEKVVNRFRSERIWIGLFRQFLQVDRDMEPAAGREFLSPALDERLSLGIQIPVAKGGRIHRVEQLRELANAQLDAVSGNGTGFHVKGR